MSVWLSHSRSLSLPLFHSLYLSFISFCVQARTACDAWKKEAAMAKQKADIANKEKEAAIIKAASLQKEVGLFILFFIL